MTINIPSTVVPGQPIVPIVTGKGKFLAGNGTKITTFEINGAVVRTIVSCVLGKVQILEEKKDEEKEAETVSSYTVSVLNKNEISSLSSSSDKSQSQSQSQTQSTKFSIKTPSEHDVVLARVSKITNNRIYIEILNIDDSNLAGPESRNAELMTNLITTENGENFKGIIRSQDIRSTNRDTVKVGDCFRPGDIVRAEIISLGDGLNYYLSTARDDLGVVFAKSEHGNGPLMYALDWETMIVPSTGEIEKRKCAKPF